MDISKLFTLTSDELDEVLREEIENLIAQVDDEDRKEKLRQLQWRLDGIKRKYKKNNYMRAYAMFTEMMESLRELNEHLKPFVKREKKDD